MNAQKALQKAVAQVDELNIQICLKLPAGRVSIQQQIKQINTAEKHLQVIKTQLLRLSIKDSNTSRRYHYLSLIYRIEKTLQNAINFKHLAEEFFVDPEGAISLLQDLNQKGSPPLSIPNSLEIGVRIHIL